MGKKRGDWEEKLESHWRDKKNLGDERGVKQKTMACKTKAWERSAGYCDGLKCDAKKTTKRS